MSIVASCVDNVDRDVNSEEKELIAVVITRACDGRFNDALDLVRNGMASTSPIVMRELVEHLRHNALTGAYGHDAKMLVELHGVMLFGMPVAGVGQDGLAVPVIGDGLLGTGYRLQNDTRRQVALVAAFNVSRGWGRVPV